jgi:hypothetical protein
LHRGEVSLDGGGPVNIDLLRAHEVLAGKSNLVVLADHEQHERTFVQREYRCAFILQHTHATQFMWFGVWPIFGPSNVRRPSCDSEYSEQLGAQPAGLLAALLVVALLGGSIDPAVRPIQ